MMKTSFLFLFVLCLTLLSCAKNDGASSTPPSEVTSSGCRLDNALDIASESLLRGESNLLVLGNLVFDKNPSGLPPEAMQEMELHLFQQYFFGFGGHTTATTMLGFKLTNIKIGFDIGTSPVAATGGAFHQSNDKNGNVQRFITVRGNESDPDWKIEAVLKGNSLNALEITHPVVDFNGQRVQEKNCLRHASVLQYFK